MKLVPAIHRATHRIGLYLAAANASSSAGPSGGEALSQGEAHILAHLATSGPATIGDLHKGLAHKRSTLTSILDRLTARGLITREVGADDRRTFVIDTTAKGRQAARRVHRHLAALEAAVARRVTTEEIRACAKVLATVEDLAHESTREARARR